MNVMLALDKGFVPATVRYIIKTREDYVSRTWKYKVLGCVLKSYMTDSKKDETFVVVYEQSFCKMCVNNSPLCQIHRPEVVENYSRWTIHSGITRSSACSAIDRKAFRFIAYQHPWLLIWKYCHFDEIFITDCTGSCQNDNFQCS